MLSDSKPGSLCIIPCYIINGKPMYFYNEWKKSTKAWFWPMSSISLLEPTIEHCFERAHSEWYIFSGTLAELQYDAMAN